eukprot:c13160_g1_i1.p1 GENE.c13160_g1_i1~~c13160_g1_i1.p1  ORF type:complete len:125 (+),score=53.05 c13160_g1_i1:39-377(+)
MAENFKELAEQLKPKFDEILKEVLDGKTYSNETSVEWRNEIATKCGDEIAKVTEGKQPAVMNVLTVMVFENVGFNRSVVSKIRESDGVFSVEYAGDHVRGIVDAFLAPVPSK